ncbi:hypothetical protein D3C85_1286860 [compost metagenome]
MGHGQRFIATYIDLQTGTSLEFVEYAQAKVRVQGFHILHCGTTGKKATLSLWLIQQQQDGHVRLDQVIAQLMEVGGDATSLRVRQRRGPVAIHEDPFATFGQIACLPALTGYACRIKQCLGQFIICKSIQSSLADFVQFQARRAHRMTGKAPC